METRSWLYTPTAFSPVTTPTLSPKPIGQEAGWIPDPVRIQWSWEVFAPGLSRSAVGTLRSYSFLFMASCEIYGNFTSCFGSPPILQYQWFGTTCANTGRESCPVYCNFLCTQHFLLPNITNPGICLALLSKQWTVKSQICKPQGETGFS